MTGLLVDLRIAWMNLIEHGRRSLFLGGAISVVTCVLVLLAALSAGIQRTVIDTATTLTTGHLNVSGFYKASTGQATPAVTDYARVLDAVAELLPEMDFAVQRGRGFVKVISDQGAMTQGVFGLDLDKEDHFKRALQLRSGNLDDLAQPNTLLIFEGQVEKLKVRVGDQVTLSGQTVRGAANTLDCRVVAIARDVGLLSHLSVFVSNESLRKLFQQREDVTGIVMIHLKQAYVDELGRSVERLRTGLESKGYSLMPADPRPLFLKMSGVSGDWTGQKLDVTTWKDEVASVLWSTQVLQALSFLLMGILITIVIAGVVNTLWISIRERTREIGTLRAIGMQRRGIARLFLLEASLLGALAASSGSALGVLGAWLLNVAHIHVPLSMQMFLMRDTLQFVVEPQWVCGAFALLTAVTGLAALYPASRAARLKPVDAMVHAG